MILYVIFPGITRTHGSEVYARYFREASFRSSLLFLQAACMLHLSSSPFFSYFMNELLLQVYLLISLLTFVSNVVVGWGHDQWYAIVVLYCNGHSPNIVCHSSCNGHRPPWSEVLCKALSFLCCALFAWTGRGERRSPTVGKAHGMIPCVPRVSIAAMQRFLLLKVDRQKSPAREKSPLLLKRGLKMYAAIDLFASCLEGGTRVGGASHASRPPLCIAACVRFASSS